MLVFTCQFCNELCSEIQWHQSLIRSIISLVHAIALPNDKVNEKKKRKCVYNITDSEKLLIYSALNEKTTGPGGATNRFYGSQRAYGFRNRKKKINSKTETV